MQRATSLPISDDFRPVRIIRPPRVSFAALGTGLLLLRGFSGLFYTLTALRLNVRYKQSILGWLWAVLQPLSLVLIYTVIFTTVTRVDTGGTPYPVFVFSGLLPWLFFSNSVTNATVSLVNQSYLLTRVYFPREIVPFSYVAAALVDFLVAAVILAALMFYYRIPFTSTLLLALPILFILIVFAAAVALLMSALQARFRDVGVAMPLLLQIWMFATPIVYPLRAVPLRFRAICLLNPLAAIVDAFRRVVLQGIFPDLASLAYSAICSIIAFVVAYAVFKNLDANMADVI